jgi:hypothetical protein
MNEVEQGARARQATVERLEADAETAQKIKDLTAGHRSATPGRELQACDYLR